MSPTEIRPVHLPELRHDLVQHMASERGLNQLGRFEENRLTTGESVIGAISSEDLRADEISRLSEAALFYVSSEMTELTKAASDSLPFFDLNREDLPAEQGFIVFAEPVATYSNDGKPDAKVRACCWEVMEHGALWLTFYTDWHEWLEDCRKAGTFRPDSLDDCLRNDHWLYFETFVFSPLKGRREVEGEWEEDAREVGALDRAVRAAWLLMQQPLAETSDVLPDRAARRRLQRAGQQPSTVRVIGLRRPKGGSEKGDGGRDYHHQWIVRGHWRQQWYPSRQVHRPVWIAPHVKGPEGAPMIGGEKVYAWKE